MNLYVTTSEIKTYLGIAGSTLDSFISMSNEFATAELNEILLVSDLALHLVTDEVHDACGTTRIELQDMHAVEIGTILDGITEYTQTDPYQIDSDSIKSDYILNLDYGLSGGRRDVTIDYAAGWNASGMATIDVSDVAGMSATATITIGTFVDAAAATGTITVLDFTGLVGKVVVIGPDALVEGVDFTAATNNNTTATSLAAAISALSSVNAAAVGPIITITAATVGVAGNSITIADNIDVTDATLSGSTLTGGGTTTTVLTRGTEWTAQSTASEEATKIAAAINAVSDVRSFALLEKVYVIEDSAPQVTGRTLATSDAVRLTASDTTLDNVDFPQTLRMAVILMVAGRLAKRKNTGVSSYTIGSKSVTFETTEDAAAFKSLVAKYKRAVVHVI